MSRTTWDFSPKYNPPLSYAGSLPPNYTSGCSQYDDDDDDVNVIRYSKVGRPLGEGTYGVVYKAFDNKQKCYVALKKMTMNVWKEGIPPTALREISVLRELRHPNVVDLFDSFVSRSGNLYLAFELMNADLAGLIKTMKSLPRPGISSDWVKYLTWQMLLGVDQCHRHRVIHRDLKPQNILIDTSNGLVKLADFGLARSFSLPLRPYTHEVVTLWYRSPEVLLGQNVYSPAIDIWSLGCIFAELASGNPIFQGDSEIDQLFKIFKNLGTPDASVWEDVERLPGYNSLFPKFPLRSIRYLVPEMDPVGLDLLAHMLRFNPAHRITAAEALAHPYFCNVAKPTTPLLPEGHAVQSSPRSDE